MNEVMELGEVALDRQIESPELSQSSPELICLLLVIRSYRGNSTPGIAQSGPEQPRGRKVSDLSLWGPISSMLGILLLVSLTQRESRGESPEQAINHYFHYA